jgi:hypothetical protein
MIPGEDRAMRAESRKLSVYINQSALRAWLSSSGKPESRQTTSGAVRSPDALLQRPTLREDKR